MSWLSRIYSSGSFGFRESETKASVSSVDTLSKMRQTLRHFLYETYTRTRIDQLFNIIIGESPAWVFIFQPILLPLFVSPCV